MARLIWTIQAIDDIECICEYIARDSQNYARTFAQNIVSSVKKLELLPASGRAVPELGDENIRELILGNYRVIYRLGTDVVEILTIYHSARLLPKDWISE